MKTQGNNRRKLITKNSSITENRNRNNRENKSLWESGSEKFRNSNRNLRGKPDQQNIRDGRENLRHWVYHRINGYLDQKLLNIKVSCHKYPVRKSQTI